MKLIEWLPFKGYLFTLTFIISQHIFVIFCINSVSSSVMYVEDMSIKFGTIGEFAVVYSLSLIYVSYFFQTVFCQRLLHQHQQVCIIHQLHF